MKRLEDIKYFATEDSITVYWRKPELDVGCYELFLDGISKGVTEKTFFKIRNVQPDTTYRLCIRCSAAETELMVASGKKRRRLDVTKAPYHACGDGVGMNTNALQQAFDDCGFGETVYFPPGTYRTGALRLHSDMELYLDEGAVLQGTDVPEDYLPRIPSRFEGIMQECYSSLLNLGQMDHNDGYHCRNVIIRGGGTIASGGKILAERIIEAEKARLNDFLAAQAGWVGECEKPETIPGRVRPRLVNISNCQNVILSGVNFRDGASWNVHMIYSDSIVTEGCKFYSQDVWNGDGWDPDSSTNCAVFGCTFHTGDDSVAIKSGKNPEGNLVARPAEHIWVFDCSCLGGHGITVGSEMSGGVSDVDIWDCDLAQSKYGVEVKGTKKRGGYVRNVHVRDCVLPRVMMHSVGYNDDGAGAPVPPVFENCIFENLQILGLYADRNAGYLPCDAIDLSGFQRPGYELKNIVFRNIVIGGGQDGRKQTVSLQHCENITLERIKCL